MLFFKLFKFLTNDFNWKQCSWFSGEVVPSRPGRFISSTTLSSEEKAGMTLETAPSAETAPVVETVPVSETAPKEPVETVPPVTDNMETPPEKPQIVRSVSEAKDTVEDISLVEDSASTSISFTTAVSRYETTVFLLITTYMYVLFRSKVGLFAT